MPPGIFSEQASGGNGRTHYWWDARNCHAKRQCMQTRLSPGRRNRDIDVVEGRITDKIVKAKCLQDLDDAPYPDYSYLKHVVNVQMS